MILIGAILLGAVLAFLIPLNVTSDMTNWLIVAFFCVADAFLTELNIYLSHGSGTHIMTRILFNFIFGYSILFLGERVGYDLYIIVAIPFAIRLLNNINWLKEHVADQFGNDRQGRSLFKSQSFERGDKN
jgi:small basic protein